MEDSWSLACWQRSSRLMRATDAWVRRNQGGAEALVQWIFNCMDDFSHGRQTDDATVAVLRVV